ncbi:restriction endonuclease subunit S [Aliivibrio kagoshimensis]|uniref:restriction endonuclease subunit S n=1 Tax=Aliivibrio kagoshimensis TaxID=2910230 RepID=UPI003D0A2508
MDGLEAVELPLSKVFQDNLSFRLDSEYYGKEFIKTFELMHKIDSYRLDDITTRISVGFVGAMVDEYREEGIQLLQTKNIDQIFIDSSAQTFINYSFHSSLKKSQVNTGDILIARSGSFGKASIYLGHETINSSDIIIIKVDEKTGYNPFYVTAFLNTLHGKAQMFRFASGGLQGHVNLTILENLKVPNLSTVFQTDIEELIVSACQQLEQSKALYKEAEQIILSALGLIDYTPTEGNISVKSISESFGESGRLDSEFYQPKFDEIEKKLSVFTNIKLRDLVNYPVSSGTTPKAGGDAYTDKSNGIPFIRAVNISDAKVNFENPNYIKPEVHNGKLKKTQMKQNDVLFSIAGTVGRCGISEYEGDANINQACAILRFDEKLVNRLYLIMYFNSFVGKQYIDRYSRQGLQTNLNLDEVGSLSIPVIDKDLQEEVASLITASFELKNESKHRLDLAKNSVELAIEKGEETAMALIKRSIN